TRPSTPKASGALSRLHSASTNSATPTTCSSTVRRSIPTEPPSSASDGLRWLSRLLRGTSVPPMAVPVACGSAGACRAPGEAGPGIGDVRPEGAVVVAPGGPGGDDDQLDEGVVVEGGGVRDEVVQRRVGGIPAVEPLDGTAPGGGQIGVLPGRAPGGSALDGAVETDVEGGRVATEDQGGGPAQDDGTALVEQLPQGGVVGGSEAVGQIFDIPGHGDVPRRPEQRQSFQHRRPGLLVAFLGADAFLDRRRCHRRGVEQPVDEGQPEAVGQKAGDDGPA